MSALPSRRAFLGRTVGAAALPLLAGASARAQFRGAPTMIVSPYPSFVKALLSDRPAEDRADKMKLYAFLVGRWNMEGVVHRDDGTENRNRGSIHAGWVLEGRALQDVWIFPGSFYGTTLRVYDPGVDAWHILWSDPLKQLFVRQLGRANGPDIVQEGTVGDVFTRWRFTERTANSFRWTGERSADRAAWQVQAEFVARRAAD
ncbi:MAG: hypothetical protein ACM3N5_03035 [Candidatus Eiseniibacteriota bacterium]